MQGNLKQKRTFKIAQNWKIFIAASGIDENALPEINQSNRNVNLEK